MTTTTAPSRLGVIRRADGVCVASELHATYPMRLHILANEPRTSPGKALCCYLIGFGGGIVSGDDVYLDVCVGENAALLVTSQSTTKAFRSVPGRPISNIQATITAHPGALMVWCPQPTQCFEQSNLSQSIHVNLQLPDSASLPNSNSQMETPSLVLLDWYTGGRRNIDNGGWQLDCLKTTTTISLGMDCGASKLAFRDASMVSGCASLQRHMGNFHVVAMMVLIGPRVQRQAQDLLSIFSSRGSYNHHDNHDDIRNSVSNGFVVSCGTFPLTQNQPNGVLVRIASHSLEQMARFFSKYIGHLDGQLSHDPFSEIVIAPNGQERNILSTPPSLNELDSKLISSWARQNNQRQPSHCAKLPESNVPFAMYQLVDASTPTGGFAHSNTLEVAMQTNLVKSSDDLFHYTWDFLLQTHSCMVPFLIRACSIFRSNNRDSSNSSSIDEWSQLDQSLAVTVTSHVTNRASCFQGSALLRAFGQTFPEISSVIKLIRKHVLVSHNPNQRGHAATCFGAICGLLNIEERLVVSMFIYITARDMINAAVRLNLVGPLQGSQLIHCLCTKFDELVLSSFDPTSMASEDVTDHAFQVAPLIEILANAHDRLYTRLFNS